MHLTLLVAGLHVDADELTPERAQGLPVLPALETLLRFGSRSLDGAGDAGGSARADGAEGAVGAGGAHARGFVDWRRGLARDIGRADLAALAPARIAAAALREPATGDWLAQPVHLQAAMDHLRLHAAGLLHLDDAECTALCEGFARAFGDDALRLDPLAGGGLLLSMPGTVDASTVDPAAYAGSDVAAAPPRGPGAAILRRLMSEIEMWLHDWPQNRERQRRGQLPLNGLWLWGGDGTAALPQQRNGPLPRLFADDPYVAGLARLAGGEARPLPPGLASLAQALHEAGRTIVVLDALPRDPRDQPLQRLEEAWFAPALQALHERRLRQVSVVIGGRGVVVGSGVQWRLWRRRRPWWQALGRGGLR